jgi:hypothetical protein
LAKAGAGLPAGGAGVVGTCRGRFDLVHA